MDARSRPLLLGAVLLAGCSTGRVFPFDRSTPVPAADGAVVTQLDLLNAGRRLADDYVAALPAAEQARVASVDAVALRAAVRVAIRLPTGRGYHEDSGSGVLVASGDAEPPRLLSAGHVFASAGAAHSVVCRTTGGLALEATTVDAVHAQDVDRARLQVAPVPAAIGSLPRRASPRAGSLVIAYGYPDRCGVDEAGRTVHGAAFGDEPLAPLRLVLRVIGDRPLRLEPVAGALPLGGFSGGGIFDLDGRVVGVLTGMSHPWSRDALVVTVTGTSVDDLW
jgi:hypothetical protein